jgi:hypothetical protein
MPGNGLLESVSSSQTLTREGLTSSPWRVTPPPGREAYPRQGRVGQPLWAARNGGGLPRSTCRPRPRCRSTQQSVQHVATAEGVGAGQVVPLVDLSPCSERVSATLLYKWTASVGMRVSVIVTSGEDQGAVMEASLVDNKRQLRPRGYTITQTTLVLLQAHGPEWLRRV